MQRILALLLFAALLAGCQTIPPNRLSERVLDRPELLSAVDRVVLLPLEVEIREMSASGISEVVPSWTRTARRLLRDRLLSHGPARLRARAIEPLPEDLPEDLEARVREHAALARLVWLTGVTAGGPGWQHKARHFDYTIGPGLAPLAEHTGADHALLLVGEDLHTTSGRKALMVGLAALGVGIPLGHTILGAALIDLRTGDLLWTNLFVRADDTSLTDPQDVADALDALFADYPGLGAYRKFARGG